MREEGTPGSQHPIGKSRQSAMESSGSFCAGDDVTVSGISCRLPESDNMEELRDNLMGHVDMVTEDDRRWPPGNTELPPCFNYNEI